MSIKQVLQEQYEIIENLRIKAISLRIAIAKKNKQQGIGACGVTGYSGIKIEKIILNHNKRLKCILDNLPNPEKI